MKVQFKDMYLKKLYANEQIKGKPIYPLEIVESFKEKVLLMEQLINTKQLRAYKSLHFEALKGNKKGLYSIRVNKQYRIEFSIENNSIILVEIILIEALSKHYK